MKRLITTYILLAAFALGAQALPDIGISNNTGEIALNTSNENSNLTEIVPVKDTFLDAVNKNDIPFRTMNNLAGITDGYYAIVGVFSEGKNLKKIIKKLKRKGFAASSILNPENSLNYVYIQYYPYGLEATDAYLSEFKGRYSEDVWILEVENSKPSPNSSKVVEEPEFEDANNSVSVTAISYDILTESQETRTDE